MTDGITGSEGAVILIDEPPMTHAERAELIGKVSEFWRLQMMKEAVRDLADSITRGIEITLKKEEAPECYPYVGKRERVRDWEQRNRKQRRR